MDNVIDIATYILLGLGCFFGLTGGLGMLRMPDFYTRLHPAGKADSLAQMLFLTALALQAMQAGSLVDAGKFIVVSMFLIITTPAATHAITQAAYRDGLVPWDRETGGKSEERHHD